jgi:SagB-type dehydrogenase family enzyme
LLPAATLEALIRRRESCRRFTGAPITSAQLSALLFAAYGSLETVSVGSFEQVTRPVPSGGGLYPLEIYAVVQSSAEVPAGIHHFNALHHGLELLQSGSPPATFVSELFMNQPYVSEASCLFVTTSVVDRSLWKYEDRGYRYILFEAGHVAQNLGLAAAALGLGALSLGGFFDLDLAELLGVDPEVEVPLYVTAVGPPDAGEQPSCREPRGGFGAMS